MIAKLRGLLDTFAADHAVVDVNGVGYLVFASTRTLAALGPVGGEIVLHTVMQVSQDDIRLIGFASGDERDWFRLLISVQGVGARVALAILSTLPGDDLHRAVASGDSAMIARSPGVGPKLAQRIVHELKDKVGSLALGPRLGLGARPGQRRRRRRLRPAQPRLPSRRGRGRGRQGGGGAGTGTPPSTRWSGRR